MNDPLQQVTENVLQRARQQGYTVPGEVCAELAAAGLAEELWKDVLALARSSLHYRGGKYWYQAPLSDRAAQEKGRLDVVGEAIRAIIEHQRARDVERRGQERVEFVHPVVLLTEDDREHAVLTRDLSVTGIRLIGSRRLLGQKVRLRLPRSGAEPLVVQVRILWTCAVGDDLYENGGSFLGLER
jgi:hypothetical protein